MRVFEVRVRAHGIDETVWVEAPDETRAHELAIAKVFGRERPGFSVAVIAELISVGGVAGG